MPKKPKGWAAPWIPPLKTNRARAKVATAARRERISAIVKRTYVSRRELDEVIRTGISRML